MNQRAFAAGLEYALILRLHPNGTVTDRTIRDLAALRAWRAGIPVVGLAAMAGVSRWGIYRAINRVSPTVWKPDNESQMLQRVSPPTPPAR